MRKISCLEYHDLSPYKCENIFYLSYSCEVLAEVREDRVKHRSYEAMELCHHSALRYAHEHSWKLDDLVTDETKRTELVIIVS